MPAYRYQQGDRPLDGYTIEHALGRGGFGEVYFAVSDAGREVALKSVQNYEDIELRGIGHCMNLKSPHLVMIFDVKQGDDGTPWVIMEFVSGASLRDILDDSPDGLTPQQAAFFVRELAKGIDYLHDAGIVHRDLKPHNVFFEDGIVKIGDYSLSKVITLSHASGHTMTVGSVHYMAPEISMGKYDKTVDLYALGVMLYEMLTGTPPFVGESVGEVLMKHLNAELDVSHLPEPFASVIQKAMDRDPSKRFQSARQMADALGPIAADRLDESIPASLSLVGQQKSPPKTAAVPNPSTRSRIESIGPEDLADTVGAANEISDTAESQPNGSKSPRQGSQFPLSINDPTEKYATLNYLIRVTLSMFVTVILMWVAFVISVRPEQDTTVLDAIVMPMGVWPIAILLAMMLVLLVPQEKSLASAIVSRAWLSIFWLCAFAVLEVLHDVTSRYELLFACLLGMLCASLLMDWRAFCDERRTHRILILRTLVAGAISGIGGAIYGNHFGYGLDFVSLAMGSTMSAAITVQLVSMWDEPDPMLMERVRESGSAANSGSVVSKESLPGNSQSNLSPVETTTAELVAW